MKPVLYQLHPDILVFPDPSHALDDPDGLLAIGGDLSPNRLIQAYRQGIFPWFSEFDPLMWWSPAERGVLEFDDFYINRTFRKFLAKHPYRITVNQAFTDVISHCAQVPRNDQGTWITGEMVEAYIQLHELGHAHSFEVWHGQQLVGGLYGVLVGACFCGESMFHLKPNTSRLAYWSLVQWLRAHGGHFIDCQMQNDFLATLGVSEWPRELYLRQLALAAKVDLPQHMWQPQTLPYEQAVKGN